MISVARPSAPSTAIRMFVAILAAFSMLLVAGAGVAKADAEALPLPAIQMTPGMEFKVTAGKTGSVKLPFIRAAHGSDSTTPCTAKAVVTAKIGGKSVTLFKATKTLGPFESWVVQGRLSKANLKKLKKAKKLTAKVSLTVSAVGGVTRRDWLPFSLKAPKK